MPRHTSLSALRRCHPTLTGSLNGCAPLSVSSYASVGLASSQLLPHTLARPFSRQLHLSSTRLSSAPQPKSDSESQREADSQPELDKASEASPASQLKFAITLDPLNPPATTRPPPLDLPTRDRQSSTFAHLYATGKAFLTFYKAGLKQIWTNTKLVRSLPSPASTHPEPRSLTLLRLRNTHDVRRLPLFAVLLLVCGEFTPLVVLLLPQIVPYTCRIPKQVRKLRVRAEERAAVARQEGKWRRESGVGTVVDGRDVMLEPDVELPIVARILGVVGQGWDRIGWVPGALARSRVHRRWDFLVRDDEMIREHENGVDALVEQEVQLACVDRAINTVDRDVSELRETLKRWLELTGGAGDEEARTRMEWLVTRGEEEWPEKWPSRDV